MTNSITPIITGLTVTKLYSCSNGSKKPSGEFDIIKVFIIKICGLRLVYFKCVGKGELVGLGTSLELD